MAMCSSIKLILGGTIFGALISCSGQPAAIPPDGAIVLDYEGPMPCTAEVVHTGIVLQGDLAGSVPDPIGSLVRDSRGFFYSGTAAGSEVAMWDPSGRFLRAIGRKGEGPGELLGGVWLYIDSFDTIHVRDNGGGWTVFDTAGVFARRMTSRHLGTSLHTTFLDDGRTVTTRSSAGNGQRGVFHITDRKGEWVGTFGELPAEDEVEIDSGLYDRVIAYSGGDRFWTAEGMDEGPGYVLQEWSLNGERLRQIFRPIEWFKGTRRSVVQFLPGTRPPGAIRIHADSSGLLFVQLIMPNRKWSLGLRSAEAIRPDMMTARLEIINPDSPTVLASITLDEAPGFPVTFFSGARDGWVSRTTDTQLPQMLVVRLAAAVSPAANENASCLPLFTTTH